MGYKKGKILYRGFYKTENLILKQVLCKLIAWRRPIVICLSRKYHVCRTQVSRCRIISTGLMIDWTNVQKDYSPLEQIFVQLN